MACEASIDQLTKLLDTQLTEAHDAQVKASATMKMILTEKESLQKRLDKRRAYNDERKVKRHRKAADEEEQKDEDALIPIDDALIPIEDQKDVADEEEKEKKAEGEVTRKRRNWKLKPSVDELRASELNTSGDVPAGDRPEIVSSSSSTSKDPPTDRA